MDLKFYSYEELDINIDPVTNTKVIIFDIDVGWTTLKDMDIIEKFVKQSNSRSSLFTKSVFIRLVDQFEHQGSNEIYLIMRKISTDYNIPIIRTYDVNYYDLPNQLDYIPYPYIEDDEITRNTRVANRVILSGASVKGIYPMREKLYEISNGSCLIETLDHPGYSGRYWSSGKIGNDYIDKLSHYYFMICTTCNESYELLKYIECAEAGCIPVGEIPNSLKGTEAENYIIQVPDSALINGDEFDKWFSDISLNTDYHRISTSYRRCIKEMRDKNKIKDNLLNIINNEIYKRSK
jgi:hypothetical protein